MILNKMIFKKEKKNQNSTVGSVVRCVTDGATWVHINSGTFDLYKERKYALRTMGKFLH